GNRVIPIREFCDDEFSDAEINVMESVMKKYGSMTSEQLIAETHREGSLWWNTAKETGLLQDFEDKRASCSNVVLDFGRELCDDAREFYE
ncbi:type II toxin-antitoxin system antitoxin SocA domain-containing protein, partial [Klebsiella pneumoniae]|uniref:type II toxin-antitoxin system antitoxin SocA domain-containing protein n=1 Tax=Klebsiella pneumoniae TaxID=573 RepID=UPI003AF80C95